METRFYVLNNEGTVVADYGKREFAEKHRDKLNGGKGAKAHMPYTVKKIETKGV